MKRKVKRRSGKCGSGHVSSQLLEVHITQVMGVADSLRQPALPEVPGSSGAPVACRPRGRASAAALLPRGVHAALGGRRHRLAEQGGAYGLLFKAASETMLTIAADPKHLGRASGSFCAAYLGIGAHPSSACAYDRSRRWAVARRRALVPCRGRRRRFFLPVRVLSRLFRRLVLARSLPPSMARVLGFQGSLAKLAPAAAFAALLKPLRWKDWFVYMKKPFAGPRRCSPICRATPTGWPSRTQGSLL